MALVPTYNVVNLAGISQSVINLLLNLADEAFRMWSSVLAGNANLSVRIELVETSGAGRAEATWGNGTNLGQVGGVNDRFGHAFGDRLLCSVAERLRETIGEEGLVVRQGGDEFAVLLPPGSALNGAGIADRLLFALVRPHLIENIPITVRASVGVAQWPEDGARAAELFEHADQALYRAKAEIRGEGRGGSEALEPAAATA